MDIEFDDDEAAENAGAHGAYARGDPGGRGEAGSRN